VGKIEAHRAYPRDTAAGFPNPIGDRPGLGEGTVRKRHVPGNQRRADTDQHAPGGRVQAGGPGIRPDRPLGKRVGEAVDSDGAQPLRSSQLRPRRHRAVQKDRDVELVADAPRHGGRDVAGDQCVVVAEHDDRSNVEGAGPGVDTPLPTNVDEVPGGRREPNQRVHQLDRRPRDGQHGPVMVRVAVTVKDRRTAAAACVGQCSDDLGVGSLTDVGHCQQRRTGRLTLLRTPGTGLSARIGHDIVHR
jgi:hypothetical protein